MAIVLREPERGAMLSTLGSAKGIAITSGTMIEVRIDCIRRGGRQLVMEIDRLIEAIGIRAMPQTEDEVSVACTAFEQYGKGSGHPAQLNFGDLFSYALAKARGLPLLFKGNDFAATDIVSALAD